jgi:hypothetical protein
LVEQVPMYDRPMCIEQKIWVESIYIWPICYLQVGFVGCGHWQLEMVRQNDVGRSQ